LILPDRQTIFLLLLPKSKTIHMERVETLSDRLKAQLNAKAGIDDLLLTVQMLQSELLHLKNTQVSEQPAAVVSFHMPDSFDTAIPTPETQITEESPTFMLLEVDEEAIAAELEEMKMNAELKNKLSGQNRPAFQFDPIEDTPTLFHQQSGHSKAQKELHETIGNGNEASVNDALRQQKTELSDTLKDMPIKDLKKAIGINDRFLFIKELFRGDEVMYERSIKTINGFSIYPESEYWIRRELKFKLGWDDQDPIVKQFDQLVKRRFSAT
jgi:hypothetical protein